MWFSRKSQWIKVENFFKENQSFIEKIKVGEIDEKKAILHGASNVCVLVCAINVKMCNCVQFNIMFFSFFFSYSKRFSCIYWMLFLHIGIFTLSEIQITLFLWFLFVVFSFLFQIHLIYFVVFSTFFH